MIDVEPLIVSSFERIFPQPAPEADWDQVIRRAGVRSRRYLVALAVVAALLLAPAAWAVSRAFEGTPAPPSIRHEIRSSHDVAATFRGLPRSVPKQIRDKINAAARAFRRDVPIVSKAHGVMQVQTGQGRLDLWAAPTKNGGTCDWIGRQSDLHYRDAPGTSDCYPATSPVPHSVEFGSGSPLGAYEVVDGYVYGRAATVRVRFADGRALTLPVIEHLFLGVLHRGLKSLLSGHEIKVLAVTARDERGWIVASWSQSPGLGPG